MTAFLLAFVGPPLGLALAVTGGLMAWRGGGNWRTAGWWMVWLGLALLFVGGVMYWQIGQVNWGL